MKALAWFGPERLELVDVADPVLQDPDDAIVRVSLTALCGADLFPYHGWVPGFLAGTILGHEFVGVVEATGSAVSGVRPGDRVVANSTISCGACVTCRAGRSSQCPDRALFGYSGVYRRLHGGQAERVRVPHASRTLRVIPEGISDDQAVFVADMLPTGLSGVRSAALTMGDLAVVVGCGTVGLMAILFATRVAGAVIAVDGIAQRRDLATRLGATAVAPEAAADAVAAATDTLGADAVIEAAGSPGALSAAIGYARGQGTISVIGAHFEPDFPLDMGRMFERELTLRVTWGHGLDDRDRILAMLATGAIDPTPAITHRFPLAEAAEAYRVFDGREAVKVVLTP